VSKNNKKKSGLASGSGNHRPITMEMKCNSHQVCDSHTLLKYFFWYVFINSQKEKTIYTLMWLCFTMSW